MIIQKIFSDSKNISVWSDLKNHIANYNSFQNGKIFEEFAKLYFLYEPIVCDDYKSVWLYNEIPVEVKEFLNLGNIEHGIDLVLETKSGLYTAVQCKYRNDENSTLSWSKDKIANLFAYGDKCDHFIVFSNTIKLDKVSSSRKENFQFININNLLDVTDKTFDSIYSFLLNGVKIKQTKFVPRSHQKDAVNKAVNYFENSERGQLILPCGAGKTLTSLWTKEGLNSHITLVLLPSLSLLRQIKNSWSAQKNYDYSYICVCSEKDIDSEKLIQ